MKNNKYKSRRLSEIISDIKEEVALNPSVKATSLFEEADNKINEMNKQDKGVAYGIILFVAIFILSIVYNFYAEYRINQLNNQIIDFRNTMNALEISDSLFHKFMSTDVDSSGYHTFSYRSENGKSKTYHDLVIENDSLSKLVRDLKWLNSRYETRLNLAKDNYNISFKEMEKKVGNTTIVTTRIIAPYLDSLLNR